MLNSNYPQNTLLERIIDGPNVNISFSTKAQDSSYPNRIVDLTATEKDGDNYKMHSGLSVPTRAGKDVLELINKYAPILLQSAVDITILQ